MRTTADGDAIRTHARNRRRNALSWIAAASALLACDSTSPNMSGTLYGPTVAVAGGTGRAYVTLDRAGAPTDVGLAFSESALTGLPSASTEYVFTLPSTAAATAYKHATINWQPAGHPPPMVYTVPHFDFHFYTISNDERVAIALGDSVLAAKMIRRPAEELIPAGYVSGMATAQMGMHWNDPEAPERRGEPFTKSFIYGSYDGAFIFAEPMVAKSHLETKPSLVVTPLKLPAQFGLRGYQPTSYTLEYDATAREYRIALSGFVSR